MEVEQNWQSTGQLPIERLILQIEMLSTELERLQESQVELNQHNLELRRLHKYGMKIWERVLIYIGVILYGLPPYIFFADWFLR